MPADIYIDTKRGMVYSKVIGLYSLQEALEHRDRIAADPNFRPTFNQIADYRGITSPSLPKKSISTLAERDVFGPLSQRAFVTANDWQFGTCRMFATLRGIRGEPGIRVFKRMKEALSWLGLEAEADPSWFPRLQGGPN